MKTLCITGTSRLSLSRIFADLHRAGLAAAAVSARTPALTLADWHEQALAAFPAPDSEQDSAVISQPGKLWDQLASDLFLVNLKSDIWGWVDTRSVRLLEYWRQFDPQLYFLLVYTTPQQALAEMLIDRDSADGPAGVETALKNWYRQSQTMLRFYLRHPQRSLLICAEQCMSAPSALVSELIDRWQFPLQRLAPDANKVVATDRLARYLADAAVAREPACGALHREITTAIFSLASKHAEEAGEPLTLDRALSDYRETMKQLDELTAERERQNRLTRECETALQRATAERDDAGQEAELLMLQLHQVQEELEYYFLECQKLKQEIPERVRREEEFDRLSAGLTAAESRIQRLLSRIPGHLDYQSLTLEAVSTENGAQVLHWRMEDLIAPGLECRSLRFKTVVDDNFAGIILLDPGRPEVALLPYFTKTTAKQRAEALLALCKDDWILLRTLFRALIAELDGEERSSAASQPVLSGIPISVALPDGIDRMFWCAALQNGLAALQRFPVTLRFDRAVLRREQVNPDYEHLWFQLKNPCFGEREWPDFEFRLSSAHVNPHAFGGYPKLEFPEERGQAPFERWFMESQDDFGAKMELRFALPDAMDMRVWEKLSQNDQDLVGGLILRLPSIIASAAADADAPLKRPPAQWQELASGISRIFTVRSGLQNDADSSAQTE